MAFARFVGAGAGSVRLVQQAQSGQMRRNSQGAVTEFLVSTERDGYHAGTPAKVGFPAAFVR